MSHRILLADDSLTIQKVVELTFSESDYQLRTVSSGDKALAALDDFRPELVLADVVMPGLSGYEVCEAVKRRPDGKYVPVVLLTGTFEPFDRARAERAGCDSIVTKPFDSQALSQTVAELLFKSALARLADQAKKPQPVSAPAPAPVPFADVPPAVSPVVPPPAPPGEGGDLYATTVLRIPNIQEMLEAERQAETSRQAAAGSAGRAEESFDLPASPPHVEPAAEVPGLPSWLEPAVPAGGLASPWATEPQEPPPFPGGAEMTVAIQSPLPRPLPPPPPPPPPPPAGLIDAAELVSLEEPPPPDATVAIPLPLPAVEELAPIAADVPSEPADDWSVSLPEPPTSPEPPPFVSGEETVAIVRPAFARLPTPAPAPEPAFLEPVRTLPPRERDTLPGVVLPGAPSLEEPAGFSLAEDEPLATAPELPVAPLASMPPALLEEPELEAPLDEAPPLSLQIPMPVLDDTSPTLRGGGEAPARVDVWGAPPRTVLPREPYEIEPEPLEMEPPGAEAEPRAALEALEPSEPEPRAEDLIAEELPLPAEAEVLSGPAETLATEEPVLEPPLLAPVLEAPALEAPALEEPLFEAPALEVPVLEEPVLEEPVPQEPTFEEPVLEAPLLEPPAVEEPLTTAAWEPPTLEPVPELEEVLPAGPSMADSGVPPEDDLFANEPPLPPEYQVADASRDEEKEADLEPRIAEGALEPTGEEDVFAAPAGGEEPLETPRRRKKTTTLGSYEEDEDVVTRDLDEDMEAFERTGGISPRPAELWEQMQAYARKQRDDEPLSEPETSAPDVDDLDAVAAQAPLAALVPAAMVGPGDDAYAAASGPAAAPPPPVVAWDGTLSEEDVDRVARRVVELLADRIVREVAWDVVPELAERLVRQRLAEVERGE